MLILSGLQAHPESESESESEKVLAQSRVGEDMTRYTAIRSILPGVIYRPPGAPPSLAINWSRYTPTATNSKERTPLDLTCILLY